MSRFDVFGPPPPGRGTVETTERRLPSGWIVHDVAVPAGSLTLASLAEVYEGATPATVGRAVAELYRQQRVGDLPDRPEITVASRNPATGTYDSFVHPAYHGAVIETMTSQATGVKIS